MHCETTEQAILELLEEDDAQGRGYSAATIATKICGPPRSLAEADERRTEAERSLQELVRKGALCIAGYMYLGVDKRIPRYKLA